MIHRDREREIQTDERQRERDRQIQTHAVTDRYRQWQSETDRD